jgi:hypothetical protein
MATEQIPTTLIADDAVTTAKVADDAITGALIENNPTIAGNLTVSGTTTATGAFTASGGIANAGTITAGTLGSSVVVPGSVGASLVLLNTTTISSAVASVSFDNTLITTTYDAYRFVIKGIACTTDDFDLHAQFSRNNGSSKFTFKSAYEYYSIHASSNGYAHSYTDLHIVLDAEGTGAIEGTAAVFDFIISPEGALIDCYAMGKSVTRNQNGNSFGYDFFGISTSNSSGDRVVKFLDGGGNSGNLDEGIISLYGYKH